MKVANVRLIILSDGSASVNNYPDTSDGPLACMLEIHCGPHHRHELLPTTKFLLDGLANRFLQFDIDFHRPADDDDEAVPISQVQRILSHFRPHKVRGLYFSWAVTGSNIEWEDFIMFVPRFCEYLALFGLGEHSIFLGSDGDDNTDGHTTVDKLLHTISPMKRIKYLVLGSHLLEKVSSGALKDVVGPSHLGRCVLLGVGDHVCQSMKTAALAWAKHTQPRHRFWLSPTNLSIESQQSVFSFARDLAMLERIYCCHPFRAPVGFHQWMNLLLQTVTTSATHFSFPRNVRLQNLKDWLKSEGVWEINATLPKDVKKLDFFLGKIVPWLQQNGLKGPTLQILEDMLETGKQKKTFTEQSSFINIIEGAMLELVTLQCQHKYKLQLLSCGEELFDEDLEAADDTLKLFALYTKLNASGRGDLRSNSDGKGVDAKLWVKLLVKHKSDHSLLFLLVRDFPEPVKAAADSQLSLGVASDSSQHSDNSSGFNTAISNDSSANDSTSCGNSFHTAVNPTEDG